MCLAIPGKIEDILSDEALARTARVSFGGIQKTVNISFVPEACVGDYVIVHAGFAISQLNTRQAEQVFLDLGIDPEHGLTP